MPYGLRWKTITLNISWSYSPYTTNSYNVTGNSTLKKIASMSPSFTSACNFTVTGYTGSAISVASTSVTITNASAGNMTLKFFNSCQYGGTVTKVSIYFEYYFSEDYYKINNGTDLNNLVYTDDCHELHTFPDYLYPDQALIPGIKHYSSNKWELEYEPFGSKYESQSLKYNKPRFKVVEPGTIPSFKKQLIALETAGAYYLFRNDNRLWITDGNGNVVQNADYGPSDFKDNVIPKRIIAVIQAAGGAGCYRGGGGGGGGCLIVIISLTASTDANEWRLYVGKGGPSHANENASPEDGEQSKIDRYWQGTYQSVANAAAGKCGERAQSGWTSIPDKGGDGGSGYYVDTSAAWYLGFVAGAHGVKSNGDPSESAVAAQTIYATNHSTYKSKATMYKSIGGYSAGSGTRSNAGAGGASPHGDGGSITNSGGGNPGVKGSGGSSAHSATEGNGGDGCIYLWY